MWSFSLSRLRVASRIRKGLLPEITRSELAALRRMPRLRPGKTITTRTDGRGRKRGACELQRTSCTLTRISPRERDREVDPHLWRRADRCAGDVRSGLESNQQALEFAAKLLEGSYDLVIFMTGMGVRALVEIARTRFDRAEFLVALRNVKIAAAGREAKHGAARIESAGSCNVGGAEHLA
jgi:hypothetical protein